MTDTKETRIPIWPLHDRLRRARQDTGLTSQEFAAVIEVSVDSLRRWEAGKRQPPRSVIMAYALRCSVPMWWLDGFEGPQPSSDGRSVTRRYLQPARSIAALRTHRGLTAVAA